MYMFEQTDELQMLVCLKYVKRLGISGILTLLRSAE